MLGWINSKIICFQVVSQKQQFNINLKWRTLSPLIADLDLFADSFSVSLMEHIIEVSDKVFRLNANFATSSCCEE